MAFLKKIWNDRIVEFPGRRRIRNVSTNEEIVVDVSRNEGEILSEGDAFSKKNMDDLEDRVSNAFIEVEESMQSLGESVADGKALIASAITNKGVSTAADSTFGAMAANINKISTKPRIRDLGNGYSFNVSGICPNYRELTADNFVVNIRITGHTGDEHNYNNPNIGVRARHDAFGISKNYNPNIGVFTINNYTFKMYLEERVDGNTFKHYDYFDNVTCNVKVVY